MSRKRDHVTYVSYDGMLEPLGQSQVVAYLERLAEHYRITLISFEKPQDLRNTQEMAWMQQKLVKADIEWRPLRYHRRPTVPATLYDIVRGMAVALWIGLTRRTKILHARGNIPALMLLPLSWILRARLLFDLRGFWADERVDGGLWPKDGRLYRIAKALERTCLRQAAHVVVLTNTGLDTLLKDPHFSAKPNSVTVIPTCTDLEKFVWRAGPLPEPFTLGYLGSVGTWYLFDESLRVFQAIKKRLPSAKLLILNRNEHEKIGESLAKHEISPQDVSLVRALPRDVPAHMQKMHAGLCLIKPCFSKLASAPTKLGEFLAAGIPVVVNTGVGDMAQVVDAYDAGVVMDGFPESEIERAAESLLAVCSDPGAAERCRKAAVSAFSLENGVKRYAGVYEQLLAGKQKQAVFNRIRY